MIKVQEAAFDVGAELQALTAGRTDIGAVASFVGLVRDLADDQTITAMTLEHYPGMTERKLAEVEAEANRHWSLLASLIVHRHGRMLPGERESVYYLRPISDAIDQANLSDRMTHISTGGGASLEFLEGKKFKCLEILDEQ